MSKVTYRIHGDITRYDTNAPDHVSYLFAMPWGVISIRHCGAYLEVDLNDQQRIDARLTVHAHGYAQYRLTVEGTPGVDVLP